MYVYIIFVERLRSIERVQTEGVFAYSVRDVFNGSTLLFPIHSTIDNRLAGPITASIHTCDTCDIACMHAQALGNCINPLYTIVRIICIRIELGLRNTTYIHSHPN